MISLKPGRSICVASLPLTASDLPEVNIYDQVFVDGQQTDIKNLRQTIYQFQQSPTGPLRVLVVNNADKLSELMQNTLLKVIEEPPARAVIILQVRSVDSLLPTVRSRVIHTAVKAPRPTGLVLDISKLPSLNRQEAIDYLGQVIDSLDLSNPAGLGKHNLLSRALLRLKQNLNAKLVVDELLLNWTQEFGKE